MTGAVALQDPPLLWWNDLRPGHSYETATRTIDQADIARFAGLSGDFNRAHVDVEFARGTVWGRAIAHGLLVQSVASGLNAQSIFNQRLEHALCGLLQIDSRFPRPVFAGDTLKVRVRLTEARPTRRPDRGIAVFKWETMNQDGESVCLSEVRLLVLARTA